MRVPFVAILLVASCPTWSCRAPEREPAARGVDPHPAVAEHVGSGDRAAEHVDADHVAAENVDVEHVDAERGDVEPGDVEHVLPERVDPSGVGAAPSDVSRAPLPAQPVQAPVLGGDAIVICGRRVHTGAPVVLWNEPPFYDATSETPRFADPNGANPGKIGPRYQPGRVQSVPNPAYAPAPPENEPDERTAMQKEPSASATVVPHGSRDSRLLADVVDQFVLHYDVCGLSRTCFRVLQDERKLSVHFLLDLDGTIYQTMDLCDTAWHATISNSRSVGIEIANMGAYPPSRSGPLDDWYWHDTLGAYVAIPDRVKESGIRTPGFVARPARGPSPIVGVVQGERLEQYDFTPEQYESLVKLAAVVCRELPRIAPDAPRDANGAVLDRALDDDEWRAFHGILGHYHVQRNKTDPGPAFDWEPFLARVRERLAQIRRPGR